MSIRGSTRFQALSKRLTRKLKEHTEESFPPDAQKTMRKFAMREAADFLKINQNTFRHYVSSMSDRIPTGELDKSNRRYFTLEEIHGIQRVLFEEGKTDPKIYPRRQGDEPCMVITCFNLKGGSSKTSTTVSLGQSLACAGFKVLLVDSDSQASLTNMFGITPEYESDMLTLYDTIRYEEPVVAREVIQKTYFPNIDIIPASMSLMEFEYETALSFRNPKQAGAFHTRIALALQPVLPHYDVVIFDTPPQLSFAVIAALFASRGVLIPLNASMLDVMSLASFLGMAGNLLEVVEAHAPDHGFDFVKLLITRFEATDQPSVQMASFLRTVLSESVMAAEFVKSTAIGDAATSKQTVFEVEPREVNRKTYDRAIESINRITSEIETEIFKVWGRSNGT
jgi:chromosome partitioning protein